MKIIKISTFIPAACICSFLYASAVLADTEKINLRFHGDRLSAQINNSDLGTVLQQFEKEKGILIRCDPHMEKEKITTAFDNLSSEKALHRILKNTDHSLVFDREGQVREIIVTGKGGKGVSRPVNTDPAFRIVRNTLPPDGQVQAEPVTDPAFEVIRNTDPPGGPFTPQKGIRP